MQNKFIGYYRCSTQIQKQSGLGLDAQKESVQKYVSNQNGILLDEITEVESGKYTDVDRPELKRALEICKKDKSITLLVARLDRLGRNAGFLISLKNAGVHFRCVDAPHIDNFTIGILALVAERERELISIRTKSALKVAKEIRGVRLGNPNPAKQLVIMREASQKNKREFQSQIRPIIEEIKATGIHTLQAVADCLNRRGITTRHGKQWFPATVKMVMAE